MTDLFRTGRLTLAKQCDFTITEDLAIAPWVVRHQVFSFNQFCRRKDTDCTAFETLDLQR